MSALIAALDDALAQVGEDVILRRIVGTSPNQINIDVTCRARVDAVTTAEIAAGLPATDLHVVISPTQINDAKWPGGTIAALPPFNVDQRVPRINGVDKMILRGQAPRTIAHVAPMFIDGELVRINLRVTGG